MDAATSLIVVGILHSPTSVSPSTSATSSSTAAATIAAATNSNTLGGRTTPTRTPPTLFTKGELEQVRNSEARASLASSCSTTSREAPLLIFTEDRDNYTVSTPGSTTTTTSSFQFLLDPSQGEV
ncbi:unnamed protein product [Orchesella dallaii]|uniref:Uncharacterized protein n=1 Tax=Orchesella dallaii TaxID=48710 RepID=A0ABP1PQ52_9HEXA